MKAAVYVVEHYADGAKHIFGWFENRTFAEVAIAKAKATSGLPGYHDYAGIKFEIVPFKK